MLRALGSASCDITHKTGDTICCGHWVLRLVISHTREEVRVVLYGHWVLDLVILHTRQGYDLLRALGSASCDITHQTGDTICCWHWVLRLVISHTRQQDWNTRNPESLPASSCESQGGAGHMKNAPSGTNSFDLFIRAAGLIFLCHTGNHIIVLSHGVLRRKLRLLLVRVLSFCVL